MLDTKTPTAPLFRLGLPIKLKEGDTDSGAAVEACMYGALQRP
jgi:hypothetical protein